MEDVRRELRPRKLSEFVGETFRIFGRNFPRFLILTALYSVPLAIVLYFVEEYSSGDDPVLTTLQATIITLVMPLVAYPLVSGALIYATSEQHRRQPISLLEPYRFAFGRLLNLLGATVLYMGAVYLLVFTCVGIPLAVYFAVKWLFALQVVALENHGPLKALSRSSDLVKGDWWRVLGIALVFFILGMAVVLIPLELLGQAAGDDDPTMSLIAMAVTPILGTILMTIGPTLLYYDLRLRKEKFNIDVMAEELGIGTDATSVVQHSEGGQ
jgi:hypothetical protein